MTNYEERLISEVERGNIRGVESALAAGASVDGSGKLAGVPLMTAVLLGRFRIAKFLIDKGADPETRLECSALQGSQAIHMAACSGPLESLRFLLQAGANPNSHSADGVGYTPLTEACRGRSAQRLLLVRELLKEGADPAQQDAVGNLALHSAAQLGHIDAIDTLVSQAPTTINHLSVHGLTPLGYAAHGGHEDSVSYLLSAGASDRAAIAIAEEKGVAYRRPLTLAVTEGHENVVRTLLEDGLEAIGGLSAIAPALAESLKSRRPRILERLLNVEGEIRQEYWATCCCKDNSMVCLAAAFSDPAGMSVLLAAGADETTLDSRGRRARDIVGLGLEVEKRDAVEMAAVLRALKRAPAFRAQSWRWPPRRVIGTTAVAAAAAAAARVAPLSRRAPRRAPQHVRVFRPRDRKAFVEIVSRYSEKL